MDAIAETKLEIDNFQYSFTKDFQNFSKFKRLITIIFLTFVPIYIVSKGFQMRNWKEKGGIKPPSAKKYYFLMIIVYWLFSAFIGPITVLYLAVLVYLFPISIPVIIYLLRKDFSKKEEIEHGTKSEEFRVIGFKKASFTFILFLAFTLIFTGSGLLFLITLPCLLFIFFPGLYKKLYFIPKKFLILSYTFFDFLNFIPGIYVAGEWFIEKDSEIKLLKSPFQIVKKILTNFEPFFILNVGISALLVRILLFLRGDPQNVAVLSRDALSGPGFLAIFMVVPIIMCTYFAWVWVWDDAEIKVAKEKISTGHQDETKIKETTLLVPVSDSIKRMYSYVFGLTPIVWVVDRIATNPIEQFPSGFIGMALIMFLAFFVTGVSTIFMGIMYYRSGVHEFLVNKLRAEIKEMYLAGDNSIKVAYSGIQEVEPSSI